MSTIKKLSTVEDLHIPGPVTSPERSLEEACERYKSLKRDIEQLEDLLKPLRTTLEAAANKEGGSVTIGQYKVTVSDCERETFNLKEAKEALAPKILKPFLSRTSYKALRVS